MPWTAREPCLLTQGRSTWRSGIRISPGVGAVALGEKGSGHPQRGGRDAYTCFVDAVETREITVQRTFADFDEFWTTNLMAPSVGPTVAAMAPGDVQRLKVRVKASLRSDAAGAHHLRSRANAVKGCIPN